MSLRKETSAQDPNAIVSYKSTGPTPINTADRDIDPTSAPAASQSTYQAALDYFVRFIWSSISQIPTFWNNRNFAAQYKCLTGLTFGFHSHQSKCYFEISLAHLTKHEIIKLLTKGKLHDELLTLYELAHLPFAEYGLMNVDGLDFDIVDYVKIRLDLAVNPKDRIQYLENWEFMLSRSQTWEQLNHSAAYFLEGLRGLKKD